MNIKTTLFIMELIIILTFPTITVGANNHDIIISEVMFDVNPEPNGLPPYDYLELYNRTSKTVDISGWHLILSGKLLELPAKSYIDSHGYAVISSRKFGEVISGNLILFSSFSLKSEGYIALTDTNLRDIDYINYSPDFISDEDKITGGWSIEIIDYDLPCLGRQNWAVCEDPSGGTPCRQNSVSYKTVIDETPAFILDISIISENKLEITFSEQLEPYVILNTSIYRIEPYLEISSVEIEGHSSDKLIANLYQNIEPGILYSLQTVNPLEDCAGNTSVCSSQFGIGYAPDFSDLLFNEVLFNAPDDANDYVEITNNSNKLIDIQQLKFGYTSNTDNLEKTKYTKTIPKKFLKPGEIIVLSSDCSGLADIYPYHDTSAFINVDNFPNLNRSKGYICIATDENNIIDRFIYNSDMHLSSLVNENGVSLERMSPKRATNDAGNWHSAAQTYNFGSPGVQNSQFRDIVSESQDVTMTIFPTIISPDNNGSNDYVNIHCYFEEADVIINCHIYNRQGIRVRHLLNNVLAGTEQDFSWDGCNDRGAKVSSGTYIILLEGITPKGDKIRKRGVVVVN